MATYIIGDVQGCYAELQRLLERINFDPGQDRLGFAGDLVNRGPDSLAVLRFVKNLANPLVVLGNHDFYLLAIGYGAVEYRGGHTLQAVLDAPDKLELLDWLRQQPLAIYLPAFEAVVVHAGIPPQWTLSAALANAAIVEQALRGPDFFNYLRELEFHRTRLEKWDEQLTGIERIRYNVNAFTHLRFCTEDGTLDLTNKTAHSEDPGRFRPWYEWYHLPQRVLFGHWAALEGRLPNSHCEALDTGCVWGGTLTAYRLEDSQRFSVPGLKHK
jgi:bis(5'-nucleosyl)-tetraphosphatase (symmetrical)